MLKKVFKKLDIGLSDIAMIGAIIVLKGSVIDMNKIPSGSMLPSMEINDRVWIDKSAYSLRVPELGTFFGLPPYEIHLARWAEPEQGDVVTFVEKNSNKLYIKRVIGVSGDKVELKGGQYFVNGVALSHTENLNEDFEAAEFSIATESSNGSSYPVRYSDGVNSVFANPEFNALPIEIQSATNRLRTGEWVVPEGKLFVSGDNRDESYDSRFFDYTFVGVESVTGKAKKIIGNFEPVMVGGVEVPIIFKGITNLWRDIY